MAYHCKFFAVKKGLALCNANPGEKANQAKSLLIQELGDLENMKKAMGDVKQEDLRFHVENFVMSVFANTDKEERTCETITKRNALDFKRTGDFIALLELFDDCYTQEWQEKKQYCTYKAGTILKALKQGVQPERGNPFAPPEEEKKEDMSGAAGFDLPDVNSHPIAPEGSAGHMEQQSSAEHANYDPQNQDRGVPNYVPPEQHMQHA